MKNFVQKGETIQLAAPYIVASGAGALVGTLFGVAAADLASGEVGAFVTEGVFDLNALTTAVMAVGDKVYWDNTNKRVNVTASGNTLVGVAVAAKANGETTGRVRLNGAVGVV